MDKPKIAPVVPIEQADEARKKEYGGLTAEVSGNYAPQEEQAVIPVEDRKEFVRAVLAGVPFRKQYVLFGEFTATLDARTNQSSEKLYDIMKAMHASGKAATQQDWDMWRSRLVLLSSLVQLQDKARHELFKLPAAWAEGDWVEIFEKNVLTLPRPLYLGLLQVAVDFDSLVELLIDKSQERDFWQTAGRS